MAREAIGGEITGPGGMRLPFSRAVRAGDFVYVSGQIALEPDGRVVEGGIVTQTRRVMDMIQAILAEAGCSMDNVVKCTCWLADPRDFSAFNATYVSYFKGALPARSTVRADLMVDAKVEIEAIAYKPKG